MTVVIIIFTVTVTCTTVTIIVSVLSTLLGGDDGLSLSEVRGVSSPPTWTEPL